MSRSGWRWLLASLAVLVVAHLLDGWAVAALRLPSAADRDWGRLLRVLGFAPTWGLVALALWLESRRPNRPAPTLRISAAALVVAVAVGGLAAEAAKLLIRRGRPDEGVVGYAFRSFADHPWSTTGFGFPSGHTAVAFAGAAALATVFPRIGPLVLGLAAGTGLSRIFAHAHFLSDVAGGALGGAWIGRAVALRFLSRHQTTETESP